MSTATVKNPDVATANIKAAHYDPANHDTAYFTLTPGQSHAFDVPMDRTEIWVGKVYGADNSPQDAEISPSGAAVKYTIDGGTTWTTVADGATVTAALPTVVGHYLHIAHV